VLSIFLMFLLENAEKIDDIPYLMTIFWKEVYISVPEELISLIQPALAEAVELAAGAYAKQHL